MDDELPSKGIGKSHNRGKITLMLVIGLFFSVYFWQNCLTAVSADKVAESRLDEAQKPLISTKNTTFKFDPMERVVQSVEQRELAQLNDYEKSLVPKKLENEPKNEQEQKYRDLVVDSPLEEMLPFIAKCDSETASFLIAIAKKESDFGRHSPQKDGHSCFNYWGYRGTYNQTASGYSCFDSPQQAIEVVGGKIRELLDKKIDTAEKLVVWKCGSSCAGHDPAGVRKWISDVALYHQKANS